MEFVVNDITHRLCLPDGSADILLNVFAPRNSVEFRRVLKPDGRLLVVVPGSDHISELRARMPLLDIAPDKVERTIEQLGPAFELVRDQPLEWRADLDRGAVADLARMSPSAFHVGDAELHAAAVECEATFSFRVLELRLG